MEDGIRMMSHFGLDPRVCALLKTHYSQPKVRNKLAPKWASEHYTFECGIAQGCPISVTLANRILSLIPDLSEEGVNCTMFLDDTSVYGPDKAAVERASGKVIENITSLGLTVQPKKCVYVKYL
eukprot:1844715-Amphidinium_carterae.9